MDIVETFVGIDVSKDRLDVHVHPAGEVFVVARDADGLDQLLARLAPLKPVLVAIEATGGFETIAAAHLAAAGLPVAVVNPAQVRAFATALGKRAKTDPIDALVIARFAATARPQPKPAPDETLQALADLVTRRRQIVAMIGAEKQREKRAPARLRKSIARLLKALQKELSEVEADIDDTMRGSPIWRENEDLMTSVPGVGQTIARARDRRPARTRQAWPARDRSPCRTCASHAPVRPVEGPELHLRRQSRTPQLPVHRRNGRRPPQPDAQALLPTPHRRRQTQEARPHRRRQKI